MPLFARSTLASASAVQQIADAAGASADAQMTARAGNSLKAAYQHFNNFANWEFALVEAPTILVTAPFSVSGATASANANFLTNLPTGHGVLPDDYITGQMFAVAARVTATATATGPVGVIGFAETFNASLISTAASSYTVVATRDFYDIPSDWKQPYDVRLLKSQVTLQPIGRRMYDRSVTSEFMQAPPMYYDIFGIGSKSRIRLLRAPSETDRLQLRYYRRMIYTSDPLDIPETYEPYLIAWASWHFLMNKSDGMERGNGWLQFANTGLAQMLKDNIGTPDDNLAFFPGHYGYSLSFGPNSVLPYIDNY